MSKKIDRQALLTAVESCTGLTESQRADLHQLLTETPKYGLVWEDTPEEVYDELKEEIPVMNEDRSKAIVNGNEYPNHVIIEGDNLHALTDLCYTHSGKIDVIYIDPPYNTGNKDFVYNDQFVDKESQYRHSSWLSFMEKRLSLAMNLLSDKGVIYISIDDNEQSQLKMLCDKIFGEQNFVSNIIWQSTAGSNTGTDIITVTEYILVYSKHRQTCKFDGMLSDESAFKFTDKFEKARGKYALDKLDRRRVGPHYSEALNFPITMPDGSLRYPGGGSTKSTEGWNYLWSSSKVQWGIENEFIVFKKTKDTWNVYNKRYSKIDNTGRPYERTSPFRNLITSDQCNTAQGTAEITSILGVRKFDFPKPSKLIRQLLLTIVRTNKQATILDFFAGSGTTLHATMELNKEDGGHRQCILVTNNENQICEEVTYPRNKKVIEGYDTPKGEHVEGLHDNNLRYFKMDSVSRIPSMRNRRKLAAHMVDMLRIKHNIYTRKNQIGSYTIDTPTMRYYEDNGRRLLVIMMPTEIYGVVEAIQALPPLDEKINVYVYSDGPYAYEDDFAAVADRVNVIALPGPMLKTFHRIAPKMNDVQVAEPDRELTEGEADDTSNDFNDGEE